MPPVVVAIGLAVGATAATAAVVGTIVLISAIMMVVSIGFAIYSMMSMRTPGMSAASLRDRTQVVRSAVESRQYIYGQVLVSGPLVYALSTGSTHELLYLVIALAGHQVEEIGDVYLGDKLSTDPSFTISTPEKGHWQDIYNESGDFTGQAWVVDAPASTRSLVKITKYLGSRDQVADPELMSASGGQWTANHRLRGVAYVVVRLEYNAKAFPNGVPNVKAVVKGNNEIYDPRTGQTGYTNNWALCIRDFLAKEYGIFAENDEINLPQSIAAANICDEGMPLASGGTEKRYTCNGTFSAGEKPLEIMKKLLTGAAGTVVWSQGQYHIQPAAYSLPGDYVITESDLAGTLGVQPTKSARDKFNTVRGTFCDPTDYWQPVDFPSVTNSVALAADGRELVQDIELSFTTSSATAQRISKIILERELQGISVNFPGKLTLFGFKPGDVVPLTIPRLGWFKKEFRITKWEMTENGGVNLVLREESAASYDWNSGMETVIDPAPNTSLPDPWNVPPPAALSVADNLTTATGSVNTVLQIDIQPAPDVFVASHEVEARRRGDTEWLGIGGSGLRRKLYGVQDGSVYDVRARSINILGAASDYITTSHLILGLSAPPPDVTGLRINCIDAQAHLSWTPVVDPGLSHYTVRFTPAITGAGWSSSVTLVPTVSGNSVTVPAMVGSYLVKAVRYGTPNSESTTAAVATSQIIGIAGLNAVETIDPAPLWSGTHNGTEAVGGALVLSSADTLADWASLSDVRSLSYGVNGYRPSGTWESNQVVDLGAVYTSRLTASLQASAENSLNTMSSWASLADVVSLAGTDPGQWDVTLQVSHTNDNPALGNWSAWAEFVVGDYTARAFRLRLTLRTYRSYIGVVVSGLSVSIDMPDRIISMQDVVCPAGGLRVTFSPPFRALKALAVDDQDMSTGDYRRITNKDATGYDIRYYNSAGTGVQRTFDLLASGY